MNFREDPFAQKKQQGPRYPNGWRLLPRNPPKQETWSMMDVPFLIAEEEFVEAALSDIT